MDGGEDEGGEMVVAVWRLGRCKWMMGGWEFCGNSVVGFKGKW